MTMRALTSSSFSGSGLAAGRIAAKAEGFAGLNDVFLQQHGGRPQAA
jgi:hypothetical protein